MRGPRSPQSNPNGDAVETIMITITNGVTGETETLTLTEIGTNGSLFDIAGLATSVNPADSTNNSGKLYVRAADTLTIKYIDPTDGTDSVTSGTITMIPDTTTSYGTSPVSVSTADSIAPIVSDSDQNLNGDAVETITVTITNGVTGETEVLTLTETGKNTGVFDIAGLTLSILSGDSTSVSGKLYVKPGDTVTAKYTDPTDGRDSFTTPSIGIVPDTSKSSISATPLPAIGDSVYVTVADSDQNLNGGATETITVTVTNWTTAETEVVTLTETGKNTGIFGQAGLPTSANASDSTSGTGRLYARAADTFSAKYIDPTDAKDFATTSTGQFQPTSSISSGVFSTTLIAGETLAPVITDTDQNLNATVIETVSVIVTNIRTGETETLVLTETSNNSGVFDLAGLNTSSKASDSISSTNRLYVRPGDTLTAKYTDPTDGTDSVTSPVITTIPDTTTSSGTSPVRVATSESISITVTDSDQNRDADAVETIAVIVTNQTTGETEILILTETGKNTGIFDIASLTLSLNASDSGSPSGKLYVKPGDTVTAKYTDPRDPKDSFTTAAISVAPPPTSVASDTTVTVLPSAAVTASDSIAPMISDPDQNLNGDVVETIAVVITNSLTGETEILILTETGKNTGIFDIAGLPLSTLASDSGTGSGKLYIKSGDTVTVKYTDPNDPSDSFTSAAITINADTSTSSLTTVTSIAAGDSLTATVSDSDQNMNGNAIETVTVTITNQTTGETETLTLTETAENAGIFGIAGLPTTSNATAAASGSGTLYVRALDTLTVKYVDPTDSTDSRTSGAIAVTGETLTAFLDTIQQIRISVYRGGPDSNVFVFRPTGRGGEGLPGLDGHRMTVSIADSTGGRGAFVSSTAKFTLDSAYLPYTAVENNLLFLRVTLFGETYYPIVEISAGSTSPPMYVVGRRHPTHSEGILKIPAGYFDSDGYRIIIEDYDDFSVETASLKPNVLTANSNMSRYPAASVLPVSIRPEQQIYIYETKTGRKIHSLGITVEVSITYPDEDDDGIIDGTPIDESTLEMYFLDESTSEWVHVSNVTRDKARNWVTTRVNHFTVFTLIGLAASTDASQIRVYPNPFRPNDGDPDNGGEYIAGNLNTGVIMDNVPAGSKVEIFTMLGELVSRATAGNSGIYQWDVRNDKNQSVVSGVYIVVVTAPNGSKLVDKLVIIR